MKKTIVIAVMLLSVFSVSSLFGQTLSGWWTGGNLGVGFYSGINSSTNCILSLDFPDFSIMHNDTGLFLSVSPFHLDSFCEEDTDTEHANRLESFINVKTGIDLLKDDREWDFTPYVSLNWSPFLNDNRYRVEGGFDITLFTNIEVGDDFPFRVKVASLNAGYGLRGGTNYFTAGISVDVVAFTYAVLSSMCKDAERSAVPAVASRGLEKAPVQPKFSLDTAGLTYVRDHLFGQIRQWTHFLTKDKGQQQAVEQL